MLFFTPAWMHGDAEEDALAAYETHLQAIGRGLPIRVLDFIRTVSLHDGRIQRVCYGRGSPLVMLLRCGDVQAGYYDLELTYHGLSLAKSDLRCLAGICLAPAEELLYDEFDLVGDMVVHRILFSSLREVSLVFRQMDHRVASASSRDFDRGVDDLEGIDAAQRGAAADDRPQAGDRG